MSYDYALFVNLFRSALIVPLEHEKIFTFMWLWGGYDLVHAGIIAAFGASCGAMINFVLGAIARMAPPRKSGPNKAMETIKPMFQRYGLVLLLFSWVPLVHLAVPLAGFFGMRARWVALTVLAGQAAYYLYLAQQPVPYALY